MASQTASVILVDTTVWVDLFAGRQTPQVEQLKACVGQREDLCVCGLILNEVLHGIVEQEDYDEVLSVFSYLLCLPMTRHTFIQASQIARVLRSQGVMLENPIACAIASVCLERGVQLLHNDSAFDLIAEYVELRVLKLP